MRGVAGSDPSAARGDHDARRPRDSDTLAVAAMLVGSGQWAALYSCRLIPIGYRFMILMQHVWI